MTYGSSLLRTLALAVTFVAGMGLVGAQAQVYVLESTADTVKAGAGYKADDRIVIPAGTSIRAVMPSGKTQTIRGPFTGPASDLAQGQKTNDGVVAWIMTLLQTGGAKEQTPGATRSFRAAEAPAAFSLTAIPSTAEGAVCIGKNAKLELQRSPSQRADRVIIVNAATSERGEAEFASGSGTAPWPASVAIRHDATYSLIGGISGQRRQVTVRLLDRVPADEDMVAELAPRQCTNQLEAWTREKVAAGKKS